MEEFFKSSEKRYQEEEEAFFEADASELVSDISKTYLILKICFKLFKITNTNILLFKLMSKIIHQIKTIILVLQFY